MKFTDTFINSFNDGFVQLYVGTIPTDDYEVYQKMEDIFTIEDIKRAKAFKIIEEIIIEGIATAIPI